ncbi:MAG: NUDIX hydrolase [Bacilli bacterium]
MRVLGEFPDIVYPKKPILYTRHTTRGLVRNQAGAIAIIHIIGEDQFGKRDHYEFPGGGINEGESAEDGLIREIQEELGLTIEDIRPLGLMKYSYHLLQREEEAIYFTARVKGQSSLGRTEEESRLFAEIEWRKPRELYELLSYRSVENVGKLIHARECCALLAAYPNEIIEKV